MREKRRLGATLILGLSSNFQVSHSITTDGFCFHHMHNNKACTYSTRFVFIPDS